MFAATQSVAQHRVDREYRFGALGIEDGLSQGMIYCMLQDSRGFMWFGTKEGLNRFDGSSFTVYRNIPGEASSLPDNQVYSIAEGARGRLWIGTRTRGLQLFDPVTETFSPVSLPKSSSHHVLDEPIYHLTTDQRGMLWVGGWKKLLARIDTKPEAMAEIRSSFVSFRNDSRFESGSTFFLSRSPSGEAVIFSDKGLWRYRSETHKFERLLQWRSLGLPIGDSGYEIVTGTMDRLGSVWLSAVLDGKFSLLKIDPYKHRIVDTLRFRHDNADLVARQMLVGPDNILYCSGSYNFIRYDFRDDSYSVTPPVPGRTDALFGSISSLMFDRSGNLWIGTTGHGLHTFNPRTLAFRTSSTFLKTHLFGRELAMFERYLTGKFELEKKLTSEVYPIRAADGSVWCGTANYGLLHYDEGTGAIRQYGVNEHDPNSFLMLRLSVPFIDSRNRVWIGNTQGVSRVVDGPEQWEHHFFDPDGPDITRREDNITCFHEDADGTLWLGTLSSGLAHFHPATGTFTLFSYNLADALSISADHLLSVAADPSNPDRYLWIGTDGGGLNRFDKRTGKFKRLGLSDGLPNMVVYGILADSLDRLWMSTNHGIACFSPTTLQFMNFNVHDGLQDNEFNRTEYYYVKPFMYFGGVKGHNSFDPEEIHRNITVPNIVITGLKLFNKSVTPRSDTTILRTAFPYVRQITLAHDQNMLTFEFAALDYTDPGQNTYRYRMEGLDEKWIDAGTKRSATYTYLEPGTYTFRVIGANNHGVWNQQGAALRVVVRPPWWRTFWAYAFYALFFIAVIVFIDQLQRRRVIAQERQRGRVREAVLRAEAAEFEARAVRAENERNEQELHLAATIQRRIIPRDLPNIPGYEIAGINLPAHEIGGDYYDCIPVGTDRYALVIADVTGKGIPASLLVNSLHASLLVHLDNDVSLETLALRLNALIFRTSTPSTFITFLIAVLHPPSGTIEMINAGHNPALVSRQDGSLEVMKTHGLPLGCTVEVTHYEREVCVILPGEGFLLFTDGVSEAMNPEYEPFSQEALEEFLTTHAECNPSSLIDSLIERITAHRGEAPQSDDITLVYLRRTMDRFSAPQSDT